MTGRTFGFLTTSYPRREGDGAGAFVRGMARALVSLGHRVEVLAPATAGAEPLFDEGIEIERVRYQLAPLQRTFYGAGVPDNVRRDPRAWPGLVTFPPALLSAARDAASGWDGIVSHWAVPCALVAGAIRGERPHLAVLHSADVHLMRRAPFRSRLAATLAGSATELLFASAALRRELLSWIPAVPRARVAGRCHASAMGIEPPWSSPASERDALRARLGMTRFTALTLGRLVPIKGIEHAIEAVAGDPRVSLWVVGDGPDRARLERRAARTNARVRFLGYRAGIDKAELLAAADAFVLPSVELGSGRTEGTPTALLEAAAAGLPLVASAVGGVAEVFEDGRSALLVPPADPLAIRRALGTLRGERALRRRLAANARTEGGRYLWSELAPRIEDLLIR